MYRTGIGYDTHIFVSGRKLILGGVDIPFKKGLLGHSDADVLLHSIIDALLGASGKGDIGMIFPDTDMKYKDISSLELMKQVKEKIKNDYRVINTDSVIICQEPKLTEYIPLMKKNISSILETPNVNIKATTTEKMNDEGRRKCISCQSMCLLEKIS